MYNKTNEKDTNTNTIYEKEQKKDKVNFVLEYF